MVYTNRCYGLQSSVIALFDTLPCTSHPVHVSIQRILKLLTMNCPHLLKLDIHKMNQCDQNFSFLFGVSAFASYYGTLTVLSSDAVRRDCPSPEKSTLLTVAVWALNTVLSPFLQITAVKTMSDLLNINQQLHLHYILVSETIFQRPKTSGHKMFPNSNETTSLTCM